MLMLKIQIFAYFGVFSFLRHIFKTFTAYFRGAE
jgi:hypothetical protein